MLVVTTSYAWTHSKNCIKSLELQDVETYIQSGNVVFTSDDADVTQIQKDIEDGFAQKFGFQVKVMVRTAGRVQCDY